MRNLSKPSEVEVLDSSDEERRRRRAKNSILPNDYSRNKGREAAADLEASILNPD